MPPRHSIGLAVVSDNGRFLLSERKADGNWPRCWEFPGGKQQLDEHTQTTAQRELREEIGLVASHCRALICLPYDYPDRRLLLHVWRILRYHGRACGRQRQRLCWATAEQLSRLPMPAANTAIINAIRLPSRYFITPQPQPGLTEPFIARIKTLLRHHQIGMMRLRAPQLTSTAYSHLAIRLLALCRRHHTRLLLDPRPGILQQVDADGLHLPAHIAATTITKTAGKYLLVSCHNPAQLQQAYRIGADAATLSPLRRSQSHRHRPPLGWRCFADWVQQSRIPVYALGGMYSHDVAAVHSAGGQGIAAVSAFWNTVR